MEVWFGHDFSLRHLNYQRYPLITSNIYIERQMESNYLKYYRKDIQFKRYYISFVSKFWTKNRYQFSMFNEHWTAFNSNFIWKKCLPCLKLIIVDFTLLFIPRVITIILVTGRGRDSSQFLHWRWHSLRRRSTLQKTMIITGIMPFFEDDSVWI